MCLLDRQNLLRCSPHMPSIPVLSCVCMGCCFPACEKRNHRVPSPPTTGVQRARDGNRIEIWSRSLDLLGKICLGICSHFFSNSSPTESAPAPVTKEIPSAIRLSAADL